MTKTGIRLSRRKKIFFSLITTLAFFSIAELGCRLREQFDPPRHVDYGLGFNPDSRLFVASSEEDVMVTAPAKRVSFPKQRFGHPKPAGTFRIIVLGGSSVHYLQPELQRLAERLSEQYRDKFNEIEIVNCGGFAYGSGRLVLVFREMLEYDPDLLLLYTGHNEFEEVEQLQLSNLDRLTIDRAISHSAIVRFFRDVKTELEISRLEKEHNRRVLNQSEPVSDANFARAWSHRFTARDVETRMQRYEHNLRLIIEAAKRNSIPVIIGTVPSNLLRPYLPRSAASRYELVYELWSEGKLDEGLELARQILATTPGRHQSSDLENAIIRRLAETHQLPLADVQRSVAEAEPHHLPGESLFEDHCHLNAAGRQVWIETYTPLIRQILDNGRRP